MNDLAEEFALATDGVTPLVLERFRQWNIPNRIIYGIPARDYYPQLSLEDIGNLHVLAALVDRHSIEPSVQTDPEPRAIVLQLIRTKI